jgi:hypothetical protein
VNVYVTGPPYERRSAFADVHCVAATASDRDAGGKISVSLSACLKKGFNGHSVTYTHKRKHALFLSLSLSFSHTQEHQTKKINTYV